jgi:hypothetical protein
MEPGVVIAIVVVAVTIASALVYVGVSGALRSWRGSLRGVDEELLGETDTEAGAAADREEEIRQMVEAQSYRRVQRGEQPLDIDAEVERRLSEPPG